MTDRPDRNPATGGSAADVDAPERLPGPVRLPGDDLDALGARIDRLVRRRPGVRVMVGICGMPGAGKSTLAAALAHHLPAGRAVVVPMDGFHLAQSVIAGTPLAGRRGAIDTFDAAGYQRLLARLRRRDEPVVYAPEYRREIEDPVAGAIAVPKRVPVVLTEGNYLLCDGPHWEAARDLLDEVWFLELDPAVRRERLVARHVAHGKSPGAARVWVAGPDETNARAIGAVAHRAGVVVEGR